MSRQHVAEDLELQRRTWRFERAGWVLLSVLLLAGVLGLFGTGPFSRMQEASADGAVSVDYPRFMRRQSPESIRIDLAAEAGPGSLTLSIGREWLDEVTLQSVTPEPGHVELRPDRLVYSFGRDGPAGTHAVHLRFEAHSAGIVRGEFGARGAQVPVSHVVYP